MVTEEVCSADYRHRISKRVRSHCWSLKNSQDRITAHNCQHDCASCRSWYALLTTETCFHSFPLDELSRYDHQAIVRKQVAAYQFPQPTSAASGMPQSLASKLPERYVYIAGRRLRATDICTNRRNIMRASEASRRSGCLPLSCSTPCSSLWIPSTCDAIVTRQEHQGLKGDGAAIDGDPEMSRAVMILM